MEFPAEEGGGHTASPDEHASPAGTKEAVAAQGDPTELASSEVVQFKPNESDLLQGQDLQPFDGKSHNVERAKKMEHEQAVQHLISLIGDRQVQDALDVYQSASKTLEGRKVKRQDTPLF